MTYDSGPGTIDDLRRDGKAFEASGRNIGVVVSGGNVDSGLFCRLIG